MKIVYPSLLLYISGMRKRIIVCCALLVLSGGLFRVLSQTNIQHLQSFPSLFSSLTDTARVSYLNSPPIIDGDESDWLDMTYSGFIDRDYPEELQNVVSYKMGWDEQNLYLLVNVNDSHLCTTLEQQDTISIHLNDAVELWIDSKNDSKNKIDVNDFHFITDVLGHSILFRGDKTLMELNPLPADVPQSAGITPIVYKQVVNTFGTINNSGDVDKGYIVEMMIPWFAIGVEPEEGTVVRLDLCMNDQDSAWISKNFERSDTARDRAFLSRYHFVNWIGKHDFGYPSDWRRATLTGNPSVMTTLSKKFPKFWLLAFFVTTLGSFSVIGWMAYRLYTVKQLPTRYNLVRGASGTLVLNECNHANASSHQQKIIARARALIEANLDQPISSETLADHLAISVRHLQRIIKEELHSTPTNFIHIIRLEKAAGMLKNHEANITEIAYTVGMSDASHFSRLFKRYYGVPPSHFAQQEHSHPNN